MSAPRPAGTAPEHHLSAAALEVQRWRNFFRRRSALPPGGTPDRRGLAGHTDAGDTEGFVHTEWAETEWPDTDLQAPSP